METGELVTYDNVRRASYLSMLAGADSIKTSTGKVAARGHAAVTLIMLEAVRDWRDLTGSQVGVKPAGGIKTAARRLAPGEGLTDRCPWHLESGAGKSPRQEPARDAPAAISAAASLAGPGRTWRPHVPVLGSRLRRPGTSAAFPVDNYVTRHVDH